MYKIDQDGLARTQDGTLVARRVDQSRTGLGVGAQANQVILRLHNSSWNTPAGLLQKDQMMQFVLPVSTARKLATDLLEMVSQAEKEAARHTH